MLLFFFLVSDGYIFFIEITLVGNDERSKMAIDSINTSHKNMIIICVIILLVLLILVFLAAAYYRRQFLRLKASRNTEPIVMYSSVPVSGSAGQFP